MTLNDIITSQGVFILQITPDNITLVQFLYIYGPGQDFFFTTGRPDFTMRQICNNLSCVSSSLIACCSLRQQVFVPSIRQHSTKCLFVYSDSIQQLLVVLDLCGNVLGVAGELEMKTRNRG